LVIDTGEFPSEDVKAARVVESGGKLFVRDRSFVVLKRSA
jgi:hypothetical protein